MITPHTDLVTAQLTACTAQHSTGSKIRNMGAGKENAVNYNERNVIKVEILLKLSKARKDFVEKEKYSFVWTVIGT